MGFLILGMEVSEESSVEVESGFKFGLYDYDV